jgi:hypothetical protein
MPHPVIQLAKGPVWILFERMFSTRDLAQRLQNKLDTLESLHATERFTDFRANGSMASNEAEALREHINSDWFGLSRGANGRLRAATAPDPTRLETLTATGSWRGWHGDAEAISREAVIRALEISLGVNHLAWTGKRSEALREYGIARGTPPMRNWPIEFWCASPLPDFQAAVSWRDASAEGRVTLTWLVPSSGQAYVSDLTQAGEAFELNPSAARERYGQWIIGQERTRPALTLGADEVLRVSLGAVTVISPRQ